MNAHPFYFAPLFGWQKMGIWPQNGNEKVVLNKK
jgi:hypothetical protein